MNKPSIELSNLNYSLIFVLFFVITTTILHVKSYNKFPTKKHVLQQSDHFALALGFLDNGFDFFHPTSFALNPEFPPKEKLTEPKGITAVDFPVLHFSVAILMKMFNTRSPVVFRLVSLLWSFVALFIFFSTIERLKGFWLAIFLCGFVMFQPIYSFYQDGFHVSSAAFNTFLIGFSLFLSYAYSKKYPWFLGAVIFLTLAALIRFTQIIPLLGLLCVYAYGCIKTRKIDRKIFVVTSGILLVLAYFGYNQYLRETYGSIFLSRPRIADSMGQLMKHLIKIGYEYPQNFLPLLHLVTLGLMIYLFNRMPLKTNGLLKSMKIWGIFATIGSLIFTLLMSYHVSTHDYYSLDTWLPVIVFLMVYLLFSIDFSDIPSMQIRIFVTLFLIGSLSVALEKQRFNYSNSRDIRNGNLVLVDFLKSSDFLDSLVPESSKVLIVCSWGWNTPMIGWNRQVYRVASKFKENLPVEINKQYDYIITQDASFEEYVLGSFPEFKSRVASIGSNGNVTVWKLNE